jgi:hypothetical protein
MLRIYVTYLIDFDYHTLLLLYRLDFLDYIPFVSFNISPNCLFLPDIHNDDKHLQVSYDLDRNHNNNHL